MSKCLVKTCECRTCKAAREVERFQVMVKHLQLIIEDKDREIDDLKLDMENAVLIAKRDLAEEFKKMVQHWTVRGRWRQSRTKDDLKWEVISEDSE